MNEEVVGIQKTPLVYSRRRRENVINPTSLPYCQSPSLEKGIILNPSTPLPIGKVLEPALNIS